VTRREKSFKWREKSFKWRDKTGEKLHVAGQDGKKASSAWTSREKSFMWLDKTRENPPVPWTRWEKSFM
jgi:hypothetical protein